MSIEPSEPRPIRHHLLIAGTGRAGTSFLVRYLERLGLDTGFAALDASNWDEAANAGLERDLLSDDPSPPYVVKTPFATEYIDDVLARPDIALDVVIIPVRDLVDATSSRVINELRQVYRAIPSKTEDNWRHYGFTAGGLVVSLEPIDQARILALGFHHLVERLVAAEVPIVFLAFPKFIAEPGYLFERLRPFLPTDLTLEAAIEAHGDIADAGKVRVEEETGRPAQAALTSADFPSAATLGVAALRRELRAAQAELDAAAAMLAETQAALRAREQQLAALAADTAASGDVAALRTELRLLRDSRSWRITGPMRAIVRRVRASTPRGTKSR